MRTVNTQSNVHACSKSVIVELNDNYAGDRIVMGESNDNELMHDRNNSVLPHFVPSTHLSEPVCSDAVTSDLNNGLVHDRNKLPMCFWNIQI